MFDFLYRRLLEIFPADFRDEYGGEMARLFRDRCRREGWLRVLFEALPDLAITAWRENMLALWHDLRYSFRGFHRNPGFALLAVLTLSLGIGANTAVFSVVNSVLLRSLPLRDPDALVVIWEYDEIRGTDHDPVSAPDFLDLRQTQSFERLVASNGLPLTLSGEGAPEQIAAARVSADYFETLGVAPVAGRGFSADDAQHANRFVAVLSEGFWARRFGSDHSVLGRVLQLDGLSYTVVGIMPRAAETLLGPRDVWLPLAFERDELFRGRHILGALGRLKPGVSRTQAQSEVNAVMARLAQDYPGDNRGRGASLIPVRDHIVGDIEPVLLTLMAAVGSVLLICCANVASLLLARAMARRRELAVRAALGAGRWRIVRQLLTESLLLTGLAAVAATGLAWWGIRVLVSVAPPEIPRLDETALDLPTLGFSLGAGALSWLLFSLTPAIRLSKTDLSATFRSASRTLAGGINEQRLRRTLVVAEVALTIVLLAGAGLLLRSFQNLLRVELGYDTRNLLTATINLPNTRYPNPGIWPLLDWPQVVRFQDELLRRIGNLPGVESAAVALNRPVDSGWASNITIEGRPPVPEGEQDEAYFRPVGDTYFSTVGIRLLQGRGIEQQDDARHPLVAVVNEAFVRRHFPAEPPLGRKVNVYGAPREIVGVVRDARFLGVAEAAPATVYLPFRQNPLMYCALAVKTTGDPRALVEAVRQQVSSIDAELPLYAVTTVEEALAASLGPRRFLLLLASLFAGAALVLAAAGLFGAISYSVSRRTQEFGVRMALGAARWQVLSLVLRQSLWLSLSGVALGLAGAVGLTRLLQSQLYDVGSADPLTYAIVAAVFLLVGVVASYEPARRATRIAPVEALRHE
jgi:putative ABC transport system permease protein